jgi:hypothetical protein
MVIRLTSEIRPSLIREKRGALMLPRAGGVAEFPVARRLPGMLRAPERDQLAMHRLKSGHWTMAAVVHVLAAGEISKRTFRDFQIWL